MEFTGKLREQNTSLIVTVPNEIIEVLNLKKADFCKFNIEFIAASKSNGDTTAETVVATVEEEDEEETDDEEIDNSKSNYYDVEEDDFIEADDDEEEDEEELEELPSWHSPYMIRQKPENPEVLIKELSEQ